MRRLLSLSSLLLAFALTTQAAYYIVGNDPFGGWNPAGGVEMTLQSNGTYSCKATINGTVWFVFADGLNSDWSVFNSTYRIGPLNGDQTVQLDSYVTTQRAGGDNGAYKFTGSNSEYTITLNPSTWQFIIEGTYTPPPVTTYTVAGSSEALFGTVWDPTNQANDMEKLADGTYRWKKDKVTLNGDENVEFKIVENHDWGVAYPSENYVMPVEKTGSYDVEIRFNSSTGEITCKKELTGGGGSSIYGDLNGDGEVTIADVNMLIDAILKDSHDVGLDINGDNEINIADVMVLIDLLLNPVPKDLKGDIITDFTEDGKVWVSYTGNENVTLTVVLNGEDVELHDGYFYLSNYGENVIEVTVRANGYNTLTMTFIIDWEETIPPEKIATPDILFDLTEDFAIIEAVGDGEIHLFINGVEVENPCYYERGDEDVEIEVTAIAQKEGALDSDPAYSMITIPAKDEGTTPYDPHMEGYWVVLYDKDGSEIWYQLYYGGDGDFMTTLTLYNEVFGNEVNADVPFHFVIDGIQYGPEDDGTIPVLGSAIDNPLFESSNNFVMTAGYSYSIGVVTNYDTGQLYMYMVKHIQVGLNQH